MNKIIEKFKIIVSEYEDDKDIIKKNRKSCINRHSRINIKLEKTRRRVK